MKTFFFALMFCSFLSNAQESKIVYDSTLAKKLKADKNGMKKYVLAILKTGPKDSLIKGSRRDSLFSGHMKNINRLAEEGMLAVAGPFGKNSQEYRGLFILNVKSVEEAKRLCESDPTIKEGIFLIDLFEWYGSAALLETTRIHKTLEKQN